MAATRGQKRKRSELDSDCDVPPSHSHALLETQQDEQLILGDGEKLSLQESHSPLYKRRTGLEVDQHMPEGGHSFHNITASGNSRLHLGNTIYACSKLCPEISPSLAIFEDAHGRLHRIDITYNPVWEIFKYKLAHTFRHLPGAASVAWGNYWLQDRFSNRLISPGNRRECEKLFLPGRHIRMSISFTCAWSSPEKCLKCQSKVCPEAGAEVICPTCQLSCFYEAPRPIEDRTRRRMTPFPCSRKLVYCNNVVARLDVPEAFNRIVIRSKDPHGPTKQLPTFPVMIKRRKTLSRDPTFWALRYVHLKSTLSSISYEGSSDDASSDNESSDDASSDNDSSDDASSNDELSGDDPSDDEPPNDKLPGRRAV